MGETETEELMEAWRKRKEAKQLQTSSDESSDTGGGGIVGMLGACLLEETILFSLTFTAGRKDYKMIEILDFG